MTAIAVETLDELLEASFASDSGEDSAQQPPDHVVRAELIEELLRGHTDRLPSGKIRWRGLTILGNLDLANLALDRALAFERCLFLNRSGTAAGTLRVEDASLPSLELSECAMWRIDGRGLTIGSALRIRCCDVGSRVWLVDCRVGGSVSLSGTYLRAADSHDNALNLYRAQIGGAFYGDTRAVEGCDNERPFRADGRVRLIDASVDGVISLVGAKLANPGSSAVSADRVRAASLYLKGASTRVDGRVSLTGAQFTTTVNLRAAEFHNPGKVALQLNGLKVGFRLRLDPAEVEGSVRMRNARLGVFTYGPGALESCTDLDAAGTTFDAVGYMDGPQSVETAPPSIDALVNLLCERSPRPSSSPYVQLAAVLQRQGENSQARAVGIAGASSRTAALPTPWRWVQRVVGTPFAYGYKPERALGILVGAMILLGVASSLGQSELAPNETGSCGASFPCLAPVAYAVDVVLPIVDLGQESSWHVNNSSPAGQALQLLVWMAIAVGWLASTAFVVALQRHFRE